LTASHRFGDDRPVRDPRRLEEWLGWLAGWPFLVLLVIVAAVADLGFGPTCFSPDCPNGSHPTATFVVAATVVLFVIWAAGWVLHLLATAFQDARERRNRRP
jgi:hypothetical protein